MEDLKNFADKTVYDILQTTTKVTVDDCSESISLETHNSIISTMCLKKRKQEDTNKHARQAESILFKLSL